MYKFAWLIPISLGIIGCTNDNNTKNVISQRYIHKYGYDVSKEEWQNEKHPGQVITMLREGKTVTESYEDGILHGPKTETYTHSQTVQTLDQYDKGMLVKRTTYSLRGVPQKEIVYKSPTHTIVTTWYPSGTPKSKEEIKEDILINGQYCNPANETDSRIENGTGERTLRNQNGDILSKEVFNNYSITYIETYYPNNSPHTITSYENGRLHGEKKMYAMTGEPISVENYYLGQKHGFSTYYQNGYKYKETNYKHGLKEGIERQFIDGDNIVEETEYHEGLKHGCSMVYCDGSAKSSWYFQDEKVSRAKYEQLSSREEYIMSLQNSH